MNRIKNLILLLIATSIFVTAAFADEKVVWDKKPIKVILKPGVEKMVVFPSDSVRVKIPAAISGSLSTLSNNGVIYWEADEEFSEKRILVQDVDSKETIVLHLSANDAHGTGEQVTVLMGEQAQKQNQSATNSQQPPAQQSGPVEHGYETLVRVAAKHLYAPERLIEVPAGMHRVNVNQQPDSHMIRGAIIEMTPVISFSNAGLYITAVKLVNQQNEKVILDPRDIRGKWLAATFQHATLGRKGSDTDTTALYVISDRPFWESF